LLYAIPNVTILLDSNCLLPTIFYVYVYSCSDHSFSISSHDSYFILPPKLEMPSAVSLCIKYHCI